MKKFWKNLCVGAMSIVSATSLTACKKDKEVNYDLDGDGVVSAWEEPFVNKGDANRVEAGFTAEQATFVDISNLQELKAINDRQNETNVYRLTQDIDCNGEEVCINLAGSNIYGNNKTISNFKFGNVATDAENKVIKCLFYNGIAVVDLNLYMGIQKIEVKDVQPSTKTVVSSMVDVLFVDNVHVKGNMSVDRVIYGSSYSNVDVSMLCAVSDILNSNNYRVSVKISNSSVTGKLKYYEEIGGSTTSRVAGIIPAFSQGYAYSDMVTVTTGSSSVYNVNANLEMDVSIAHDVTVGMIVAEVGDKNRLAKNDPTALVSSCTTSGKITTSIQASCKNMFVGGIAGKINEYGEVKDCKTNAEIYYNDNGENTIVTSPNFYYGGIAGANNGVVEYVSSDANITVSNAKQVKVGGIAGISDNGIFSNVLCRGSIKCNNVSRIDTAEMVGKITGGYIEKVIATTTITIDNTADKCDIVRLGMLVTFEDESIESSRYNAYDAPNISHVYMCGESNVYMNPATSSNNKFVHLLGLRNSFKYGTGVFETVTGENGAETEVEVKATRVPLKFRDLYILKNGYKVRKFEKKDGENKEVVLDISYAPGVTAKDGSTIYQRSFFIGNMGFRYGLNHNEIDLANFEIAKMSFTIDANSAQTGYFDKSIYNGEFAYFDKYINDECTYNKADEMFSYLKYLLSNDYLLNTDSAIITPLYINNDFINSEPPVITLPEDPEEEFPELPELPEDPQEPENPEDNPEGGEEDEENSGENSGENEGEDLPTIPPSSGPIPEEPQAKTQYQMFAESIQELIEILYYADKNMTVVSEVTYLNNEFKDINSEDILDIDIKYVRIAFNDGVNYVLTFDVSNFAKMDDVNSQKDAYLVYLKYEKQL